MTIQIQDPDITLKVELKGYDKEEVLDMLLYPLLVKHEETEKGE